MERNCFKEYSSSRFGVKRAATDESLLQFFFYLDRVIAWLDEVATVTQANVWVKISQNYYLRAKPWMRTLIPNFPYVI